MKQQEVYKAIQKATVTLIQAEIALLHTPDLEPEDPPITPQMMEQAVQSLINHCEKIKEQSIRLARWAFL